MSIVLQGSTSGSITLQEPAVAGSTVLSLPATSGTVALTSQLPTAPSAVGQIPFSTDGSTYTPTAKIVSGTAVNSTSGTSIDFTSIPSWVRRVTLMFNQVSTNGTSNWLVQIGSGSVTTSGYVSGGGLFSSGVSVTGSSSGFLIYNDNGADVRSGIVTITLLGSNLYTSGHTLGCLSGNAGAGRNVVYNGGGSVSLGGALDRVRITTANGTDAFDNGSINILYE